MSVLSLDYIIRKNNINFFGYGDDTKQDSLCWLSIEYTSTYVSSLHQITS